MAETPMKTVTSPEGVINKYDWQRIGFNALLFFAPAALLFLLAIQSGKTLQEAAYVLYLWGINTAIDTIRRFIGENTYKVPKQ